MKVRHWLVPVALAALVLTGCTDDANDPDAPLVAQSINEVPRDQLLEGGELRIAVPSIGDSFNPLHSPGVESAATAYLPSFFTFDQDGTATANPDFVSAVEVSPDPTVVTLSLNPNATWGDEDPLSWEDVAATVAACDGSNPDFECVEDRFAPIDSVERGSNDQQVVITFSGTYPNWEDVFRGVSTLRAESVATPEQFNNQWGEPRAEWLSGPFTFDRLNRDDHVVTWVPNPQWWGERPLLQRLTFRQIAPDAMAASFLNNQVDVFHIGIDPDAQRRAQGAADGEVRIAASGDARTLLFNTRTGALADPQVRRAILSALDRNQIAQTELDGLDWPARALNSHVWVENHPDFVDMADQTGLGYDPDAAASILDEAGWVAGDDGVRSKDGERLALSFTVVNGMKGSQSEGEQIRHMLGEVGIEVTLVNVELEAFTSEQAMTSGDFEMLTYTEPGTTAPLLHFAQRYTPDSPANWTGWSSTELQELATQIIAEPDPAQRTELGRQADQLLWEAAPVVPLYQLPESVAVKRNLANYGAFGLGTPTWTNVGFIVQ